VKINENIDFKTILESLPNLPLQESINFRL